MKLGFFTMPIHPLNKDWRKSLREDREAFILADQLGFSEAYCGEHTTDQAENITSSAMFVATLVDAVKTMRLGTGTINMPNVHPAATASNIAMLDHLLEGRFNFGVSPGGLMSDAEVFGNLDNDRNEMFLESIDTVLKIWSSDAPYNIKGKYWNVSTARTIVADIGQGIMPKPLQEPHPPIIVTAVAPYSNGVAQAAARGWHPISANFLLPKWAATHWIKYAEGCQQGGREARAENWRVARSIFVADDLETAREYALGAKSPYRFYYSQLLTKMKLAKRTVIFKSDPDMNDADVAIDGILDDLVIWGTPDKVVEDLAAFRETTGDFGTLLYAGKDWADPDLARRSMKLLAENVAPKL